LLYRIVFKHACFGVIEKNGIVIKVAPIGKWMMGKEISVIENWVISRKGKIQKLFRRQKCK